MKKSEPIDAHVQLGALSESIKTCYSYIEIEADVLHLCDVSFLTSISRHDNYGTGGEVPTLECPALEAGLRIVVRSYDVRRFRMIIIVLDKQFQSLMDRNNAGSPTNVVSKGEHAKLIERCHSVT